MTEAAVQSLSQDAENGARMLVPAVDRAIRILALLEAQPAQSFTVSEIARSLGIPKSTTFNICGALVEGQLLRRSRDGFQLGRLLVQLGSAYVSSVNLVREFYEVCLKAPSDLQATIQLGVLDEGLNVVYLAYQDCNSGLRLGLGGAIGRLVPANCSACGKALLAVLSAEELQRRLAKAPKLTKLTRNSVASQPRLLKAVAEVREQGYATDDEETLSGLCCVATAFATNYADNGFVAVSISAAKSTLTRKRQASIRAVLRQLVDSLRQRL
jgi:DNA-binding IclR family transcriptional regulator